MDASIEGSTVYRRRATRTVHVGHVAVGSSHPIRVQSMTTPSTRDTKATVDQIERLVDAGCEIVRITVPTTADADNLPEIRRELGRRRLRVPLVADIHFTPAAAMKAVEHVDKIRINPGNYADKKKFAVKEYTDSEYAAELERIAGVFSPLVERARELGVSMRIGTNHGSLSDRIMNRYGDTPEGMVESALEFVRICEDHGYRELILSMKASNPVVVLAVYRLLAARMAQQGMDYPFHLGVTEAGDGEDGRIKSALGIGTLLDEGLGDTIRVSLTEDPVKEIPVARALAEPFNRRLAEAAASVGADLPIAVESRPIVGTEARSSGERVLGPHKVGAANPILVEVPLRSPLSDEASLRRELDAQVGVRVPQETRAEIVSVDARALDAPEALRRLRGSMRLVAPQVALSARVRLDRLLAVDDGTLDAWLAAADRLHVAVTARATVEERRVLERLRERARRGATLLLVEVDPLDGNVDGAVERAVELATDDGAGADGRLMVALGPTESASPLQTMRRLAWALNDAGAHPPLVLLDRPLERRSDPLLGPPASLGGLICEGVGDSIHIAAASAEASRALAFGILQATRVRITRTEFISCPSCGRTLFDLEETTARIKRRTAHLKGVKIAVMGCIVNGPGEMADADFGYVGWGEDKIALFVGKEMVARDVPTEQADDRLVELIKAHGRWVDPPEPDRDEAAAS